MTSCHELVDSSGWFWCNFALHLLFVLFSGRYGEFYPDGIANSINFQRASPEAALSRELQAGLGADPAADVFFQDTHHIGPHKKSQTYINFNSQSIFLLGMVKFHILFVFEVLVHSFGFIDHHPFRFLVAETVRFWITNWASRRRNVSEWLLLLKLCAILLMEEIPNNHLECIKPPVDNGINYQPQLVSQISSINSIKPLVMVGW